MTYLKLEPLHQSLSDELLLNSTQTAMSVTHTHTHVRAAPGNTHHVITCEEASFSPELDLMLQDLEAEEFDVVITETQKCI